MVVVVGVAMVISVECATFTGLQENQLMYIDTRKGKILNTIQFPIDVRWAESRRVHQ